MHKRYRGSLISGKSTQGGFNASEQNKNIGGTLSQVSGHSDNIEVSNQQENDTSQVLASSKSPSKPLLPKTIDPNEAYFTNDLA